MGVEYELKFRADPATLDRLEQAMQLPAERIRMQTTYYDTPQGALSQRHWTLRRRLENGTSVCTFKYPLDGPGRGEVEVHAPSLEAALPELCKLSGKEELAALTAGGLVEVCGARFLRTAFTLQWAGAVVELALDRGVLTGGGREIPLYEAEAELKAGDPAGVESYGTYLRAAFELVPEKHSKFRRALALAKGEI